MELTQRQKSIKMIQNTYNKGKLGFQKGAKSCLYYDTETESFCAVGVLVCNEMEQEEDRYYPFEGVSHEQIGCAMTELNMNKYKGLTINELEKLQSLHDNIINHNANPNKFTEYLFSLT